MKRVLIITYYWLPSGGAGVQRWLKFVKYLREFGWEPIVYVPENPEYPSEDFSFEKDIPEDLEVIKRPIWEPYNIYRRLAGKKGEKINAGFISENKKSGWKDKLSIWIRGNFLIPDPRRFWVKPSIKYLSKYLQEKSVDAVVTTGPPHSMHLIGLGLKRHFPQIPWVADFRDPWTQIFFYKDMMINCLSDRYHLYLEKKVLHNADKVIVVSSEMQRQLGKISSTMPKIISNGFDNDDFRVVDTELSSDFFVISHIGTLTKNQNPSLLWKVLKQICDEDDDFKKKMILQLIGKVDYSVLDEIKQWGLNDNMVFINYLAHPEAIIKQRSSQVLLLLLVKDRNAAKGILTGKFFEYLAAKRPILAVGPTDGDVADVLDETHAGRIADFDDEAAMKSIVLEYYNQYKKGKLEVDSHSIEKYSRRELTRQLADLLNNLRT